MIPSRVLLRGQLARNTSGTLLRAALSPLHPSRARLQAPGTSFYSTVVAEEAVPNKKKVWDSVDDAVADVKSGDTVLSGGKCCVGSRPTRMRTGS